MSEQQYAHPEALVSTQWVADHLNDPSIRVAESNEDVLLYNRGHIPGPLIDWWAFNPLVRDYLDGNTSPGCCRLKGLALRQPWSFMAIRTTGGRRMPSGCFNFLGIQMPE
jgi:hypothetical protein